MTGIPHLRNLLLLSVLVMTASSAVARNAGHSPAAQVGVGAQYDTTHIYVAPDDVDKFATSFLATFGGQSTKQVVATVTPTPSSTTSQLLQTPVGTVSLFGFKTPIPYPFGAERTGYLVSDLDAAIQLAKAAGADVLVATFPDPIGRDAVIQWPGGINMQLYWHTTKPSYATLATVPENRVYVSPGRADAFIRSFLHFSHGKVVSDDSLAPGVEIGRPNDGYRRIRIESVFGKMTVSVTDGHLPYPYGIELTGYEVADLKTTLTKATTSGATVLVEPFTSEHRDAAMVQFPGDTSRRSMRPRNNPIGRCHVSLFVGVVACVTACAARADDERPRIGLNRWQEDWSVLADPALRTEPQDDLKYIRNRPRRKRQFPQRHLPHPAPGAPR